VTTNPTGAASAGDIWTTRRLLGWISGALERKGLDSPRLCAELLVSHVLGCERLRLYMEADRPAEPLELATLRDLTRRALDHEPVQYLVGEAWFFSMAFKVDQRALIPRPSSETIVEHVLQLERSDSSLAPGGSLALADIGTGSGCLAIALLKHLPGARAIATDVSAPALELTRENAARHGVLDRLDLARGDLLEPLRDRPGGAPLDVLVSNPPYIPDAEWGEVARNVRDYEPEGALRGGPDGLRFVGPLIDRAPSALVEGGALAIEIASSSADEALARARANPRLGDAHVLDDFEGLARVLAARRV